MADIVYSGTVLTRSYRPVYSKEELQMENLKNQFEEIDKKSIPIPSILAFLIDDEEDDDEILEELEALLRENKKAQDKNSD